MTDVTQEYLDECKRLANEVYPWRRAHKQIAREAIPRLIAEIERLRKDADYNGYYFAFLMDQLTDKEFEEIAGQFADDVKVVSSAIDKAHAAGRREGLEEAAKFIKAVALKISRQKMPVTARIGATAMPKTAVISTLECMSEELRALADKEPTG